MSLERYISELKNATPSKKATIIKIISTSNDKLVISTLIGCLRDSSPIVRLAALRALEKKKYFDENLFLEFLADNSKFIRKQVLKMLSSFPKEEYLPRIQNLLLDSDTDIRLEVVSLLEKIGKASLPLLYKACKDTEDLVREKALQAIRIIGEESDKSVKSKKIEINNSDKSLRIFHIEKLPYDEKLKNIIKNIEADKEQFPLLLKSLEDKSWTVREYAIKKISELKEIEISKVYDLLKSPVWYIKAAAIRIIGLRKEEKGLDLILPYMKDNNVEVRRALAEALGNFKKSEALIPLQYLLQDKNIMVRKEAEKSLASFKKNQ